MKTEAIEDYLKNIYLSGRNGAKVSLTLLAKKLEVKPASVSGMIKRLEGMNLVKNSKKTGIILTDAGEKIALEVIRHHRLIESFLVEALGVPWNEVHEQAEKWEHMLSEKIEDRIDQMLGYPTHDPHGDPIPKRDGSVPETSDTPLNTLSAGDVGKIERINDQNPEILEYIGKLGLYPQTRFRILEVGPLNDLISLEVGGEKVQIGLEVARRIFVTVG